MRNGLFILFGFLICAVQAQEAVTTQTVSLQEVIQRVLEQNPQLKAAEYELRAADTRVRSEQQSPPYRAALQMENFAGSGEYSGKQQLESTLSLSKIFETGNKAELRGQVAQGNAVLLRNEKEAQRLELLAETARRFLQVATNQERLKIAKEALELSRQTLNTVDQRTRSGKYPAAELYKARAAVARNELDLDHIEHELAASLVSLSILWGEFTPQFTSVRADFYGLDTPERIEVLMQKLERNPDLLRYTSEQQLLRARLALAQAGKQNDVEWTAGVRRFEASSDTAWILSATVPLGTSRRVQPAIEEVESLQQRGSFALTDRKLALQSKLYDLALELKHAADAVATLRNTVIPQMRQAVADYTSGYAVGRYSLLELNDTQRALLAARQEEVQAASNFHRLRIETDRLTGAGLVTGVKIP